MTDNQTKDRQISDKTAARMETAPAPWDREEEDDRKAGECLTPAEITAFLDNSCLPEEKDNALRHIGLCRSCYGKWLVLLELRLERAHKHRTKERRRTILSPSNIATLVIAMAAMISLGLLTIIPFSHRNDRGPAPAAGTKQENAMRSPAPLPFRQWQQELAALCREPDPQQIDRLRLHSLFRAGKSALPAWRRQSPQSLAQPSPQGLLLPLLDQAQTEEQLLGHCREILSASATTPE